MSSASTSMLQINAIDPRAMGDLSRLSRENSPEAVKAAAKQFEALFLNTVMKSMREATPGNALFDNEQTKLYQSLLDQQLSSNLAQSGGTGLADAIVRQLSPAPAKPPATGAMEMLPGGGFPLGVAGLPASANSAAQRAAEATVKAALAAPESPEVSAPLADDDPVETFFAQFVDKPVASTTAARLPMNEEIASKTSVAAPQATAATASAEASPRRNVPAHIREFVNKVMPHAQEVARLTGIPAEFMVAQAALETGWGRAELRTSDGGNSYNLFNIKAGKSWDGETVSTRTTEYAGNRAYSTGARFRAYSSYEESFRDYANLLLNSPRYAEVIGEQDAASFARGLQQAGYATDPRYADKLTRIINGGLLQGALMQA